MEHWSMQSCIADMSIPVGIDMDFIMSAVVVLTANPVPRGRVASRPDTRSAAPFLHRSMVASTSGWTSDS
jgi:hypothetical protein